MIFSDGATLLSAAQAAYAALGDLVKVTAGVATDRPIVVVTAASQSVPALEIRDSSGNVIYVPRFRALAGLRGVERPLCAPDGPSVARESDPSGRQL